MIALTGATGLVGSFLARRLLQEQIPFVAIHRSENNYGMLEDVADQISWSVADVLNPVKLYDAFQNCDTVIHAAALVSFNPRDKNKLYDINLGGTRNVVNACIEAGVRKLIHISSVAALGRNKLSAVVDENTQWMESSLNTNYGESKYLAELEVWRGKEEGLETSIINPSVVLAPGNWDRSSAKIFKYVWTEKPFYTSGSFNYIDVRDLVEIVLKAIHGAVNGERLIANAGKITYQEFLQSAAYHFKKRAPRYKIGARLMGMIARFEQVRTFLLGGDPLITPETAKLSIAGTYFDNSKIKSLLNFDFRPLDDTLQWCGSTYLNNQINS